MYNLCDIITSFVILFILFIKKQPKQNKSAIKMHVWFGIIDRRKKQNELE